MIEPAPNNPATWRRIKAGATGDQLGWPEDRVARICRDHGYEYRPVGKPAPVVEPPQEPAQISAAKADRKLKRAAKVKSDALAAERAKCAKMPEGQPVWNYMTGEFSCGSVLIAIGGTQQTQILSRLFNLYSVDPDYFAEGDELARLIKTSRESVRGICWYLSRKIVSTGWQIQPVRARGGYRLARCER
jgi:hypothetical protein